MRGRITLAAVATFVAFALSAGPAAADHHLIKISEVNPGTALNPEHEFVEVQMYASGQGNLDYGPLAGASVEFFGADGGSNNEFFSPDDAPFGGNQRTFLYGNTLDRFGFESDRPYSSNEIEAAGGAVCFNSTVFASPIDCVTWGTMTNPPPSAGTPAPAFAGSSSLHRKIDRGCALLLDAADDTNSSAADFGGDPPGPRLNSTTPTEHACPDTRFTKKPKKETTKRRAKFKFTATQGEDEFECKLDKQPFTDCTSPFKKRVGLGKHKFKVLAEDELRPAKHRWKVVEN